VKNPKAESSAEVYRLRDISKEFRNAEGAVVAKGCDRVSLDIRRGEFLAVTGESGSGKSTLLSLLGFLAVPSPAPAPGAFTFRPGDEEHDLAGALRGGIGSRRLSHWRANHIGFVFQNFHLLNHLSGTANVELGLRFTTRPRAETDTPNGVLDALAMNAVASKRVRDLSGGQKQRISVARALVKRPEVILADEPTGNLDTANKCLVLAGLLIANRRYGATVVLVTHEIEHPPRVAHRSIVMRDGAVAEACDLDPSVEPEDGDDVVALARRIARDCYPHVFQDLKWD
jgi:putative ABC transport system ATP-binding protein